MLMTSSVSWSRVRSQYASPRDASDTMFSSANHSNAWSSRRFGWRMISGRGTGWP